MVSELSRRDRGRVHRAVMLGRPLPPRLARVAVEHAAKQQGQAWYGYWQIGLGLVFCLAAGLVAGAGTGLIRVAGFLFAFTAISWLFIGAVWLRAVTRARRTVRDGSWPEGPGDR